MTRTNETISKPAHLELLLGATLTLAFLLRLGVRLVFGEDDFWRNSYSIKLRQSYAPVASPLLIKHQRYAHAKQFKRANKALRSIRTLLGRVIRDVQRKIVDDPCLGDAFALPLSLARQVRDQHQRRRGKKIYSLHALEVECIGKGKAHKPYEFGVKVGVATPANRCLFVNLGVLRL